MVLEIENELNHGILVMLLQKDLWKFWIPNNAVTLYMRKIYAFKLLFWLYLLGLIQYWFKERLLLVKPV